MPFDEKDVTVLRPFWFLRRLLQEQTNRRGLSAKLLNPIDLKLNPETCETESGMMYRRGAGQTETKKRQPPIPHPLLAHMRRCEKTGALWVVEVDGQRVVSVRDGLGAGREGSRYRSLHPPQLAAHVDNVGDAARHGTVDCVRVFRSFNGCP